jgi:hypothetical protein
MKVVEQARDDHWQAAYLLYLVPEKQIYEPGMLSSAATGCKMSR